MMKPIVRIYTDGGCWPNPGPGGWGVVIVREDEPIQKLSGNDPYTTNNKMELTAAIEALKSLDCSSQVYLTTDSQYLQKGITEWISKWIRRGWKTSANKPVENQDLWLKLIDLDLWHEVEWIHVRGHNGIALNEEADRLATEAREALGECND